jgi:chromate transporter
MSETSQGSQASTNHPQDEISPAKSRQTASVHGNPLEVFQTFLKLGLTAFGGPIAHLGYFQREIIERRKWLSQNAYGDLVALCQFLPGPASSQVAFGLGYLRAGIRGAFAASAGFTAPSAILMIAIAYGFQAIGTQSGFLHGLKLAAVAVVAQAVWTMAIKLCPDRERLTLAILAACIVLSSPVSWLQVIIIGVGALFGWIFLREEVASGERAPIERRLRYGWFAWSNIALYFIFLAGLPLLAALFRQHWLQLADAFYRSGALVFGGGHVVLPLLQSSTVAQGWLDQNAFMAGYGAAQALPGPLFTFSAYLGTLIGNTWLAGLWCLFWIFLPSFLLMLGALPVWSDLRRNANVQAALRGANAAVVGILLAALYNPVWTVAVDSSVAFAIALAAFCLLQFWKWPSWLLVLLSGMAGFLFLGR